MRLPAKISSFGGVFRYDEPQKGRYRYFHQWDVEIYGKSNLESDAEIIEVTSRLFDSLLLKGITIDVNHRTLVESFINRIFESTKFSRNSLLVICFVPLTRFKKIPTRNH